MATQKKAMSETDKKADAKNKADVVYLVNPAGAIHSVTRDHARMRLRQLGYRVASPAEVAKYKKARVQRAGRPIGTPWNPEPETEPDLPDEAEE